MLTRIGGLCAAVALATGTTLLLAAVAQAQVARYVSASGNDANNCSRDAPCRTLQRGIDVIPAGGELQILDSGAYGNAATINKAMTISAVGVSATVGAIIIDAPDAMVVLRGLHLTGRNVANNTDGIRITNAAAVHILRCVIERFSGGCIVDCRGNGILNLADDAKVFVSDTISRDNGGDGLNIKADSQLTVDNSSFENNGGSGIAVRGGSFNPPTFASITRSVAARNLRHGILGAAKINVAWSMAANNGADGYHVAGGQMTVESSAAAGNGANGLRVVTTGALARVSNSVFTGNATGLRRSGGTLRSRVNNTVHGNTIDTSGTISVLGGT